MTRGPRSPDVRGFEAAKKTKEKARNPRNFNMFCYLSETILDFFLDEKTIRVFLHVKNMLV